MTTTWFDWFLIIAILGTGFGFMFVVRREALKGAYRFKVTPLHVKARASSAPCIYCWSIVTLCALFALVGGQLMTAPAIPAESPLTDPGTFGAVLFSVAAMATGILGWLAYYRQCDRSFHIKGVGTMVVVSISILATLAWMFFRVGRG